MVHLRICHLQDSVDLQAQVGTVATVAPWIAVTKSDTDLYQFFIITEKQVLCESSTCSVCSKHVRISVLNLKE